MDQEKKFKTIRCKVVSAGMNKSRVGIVERLVKHARYDKYITRRTKYMFHDEENKTKMGDSVSIRETKNISGNKKFLLVDIIARAKE